MTKKKASAAVRKRTNRRPQPARYRVRATYEGFDVRREKDLRTLLGNSFGSGFDMRSGLRDHDWYFASRAAARAAVRKLMALSWLTVTLED